MTTQLNLTALSIPQLSKLIADASAILQRKIVDMALNVGSNAPAQVAAVTTTKAPAVVKPASKGTFPHKFTDADREKAKAKLAAKRKPAAKSGSTPKVAPMATAARSFGVRCIPTGKVLKRAYTSEADAQKACAELVALMKRPYEVVRAA